MMYVLRWEQCTRVYRVWGWEARETEERESMIIGEERSSREQVSQDD